MQEQLRELLQGVVGDGTAVDISVPDVAGRGHYATTIAMKLAKERKESPLTVAEDVVAQLLAAAPAGIFERVEVAPPGFINMWLTDQAFSEAFVRIVDDAHCGVKQDMAGKTVMVEYTDPNPFKAFHIGHMMPNAIGESFARLYESVGAKVLRANYQGDVGMHVAKAVWGMVHAGLPVPSASATLAEHADYLNQAYATGDAALETSRAEIEAINKKIYDRSDVAINEIYDDGRRLSLAYFEEMYARLGTKFDHYFFESEVSGAGLEVVRAHPEVFTDSDGAVVFKGEPYGLHTRVFINSQGLPTYEAKELGLNKMKFDLYPLDLSVIVTGNEVKDYFRVLLKAMELVLPNVAAATRHMPHGMLRLPTGKMSSRTGNVVTADALITQTMQYLATREAERAKERAGGDAITKATMDSATQEAVAIGAIKYTILKQNIGQDIVFDFDTSLSLQGDSGPYIQYTYARLASILRKAGIALAADTNLQAAEDHLRADVLTEDVEKAAIRKLVDFPHAVHAAATALAPHLLAKQLYDLAVAANQFYEHAPILKEEDAQKRAARLAFAKVLALAIERGLGLLGIRAPERI